MYARTYVHTYVRAYVQYVCMLAGPAGPPSRALSGGAARSPSPVFALIFRLSQLFGM